MDISVDAAPAPAPSMRSFQDAFARALLDPALEPAAEIADLARQPGFAVYRNTVMKGCIDALQANYPTVERLVGEEWFRAAARLYVLSAPPASPVLAQYGDGFEGFLAGFEHAAELPYLPGVARLDRYWTEAHIARDESPAIAAPPGCLPTALARAVMRPHASARWAWFDAQPIFTIWQRNRATGPVDESDMAWRGEGALLSRPRDVVRWMGLEAAGCAFLDACAAGRPLGDACEAACRADPGVDVTALFERLLEAGALRQLDA